MSLISKWLRILLIVTVVLASSACATHALGQASQSAPAIGSARPAAETVLVRIDGFRTLIWQPADNYFLSPGPVRIEIKSLARGETMVLTADDAEGRPDGEIVVRGRLRLVREGAEVTGRQLTLNTATETGSVAAAEAIVGQIRIRGDRIDMSSERRISAVGASFTTCSESPPHFRISARKLSLSQTGLVRATGVTLWVGNRPLLAVPWLEKNFSRKVESPFPLPGYTKETGPIFRLRNDVLSTADSALTYDLAVALRSAPHGNLTFERELAPDRRVDDRTAPATRKVAWREPVPGALEMHPRLTTPDRKVWDEDHRLVAYAAAGVLDYVGNRVRTDLRLSRLPEIGLAGYRPTTRSSQSGAERGDGRSPSTAEGFGYHWDLSIGRYHEKPTDVEAGRAALRIGGVTPRLNILPGLSLRAGLAASGQAYEGGGSYATLSPELEANWEQGSQLAFGIALKHQLDGGRTPFVFDRVDVRNEMRLYCQGYDARWAYSLAVSYDTDRMRAHDTSLEIRRKMDCLEFGLTYRARSQGLGVIFNLLPGKVTSSGKEDHTQ